MSEPRFLVFFDTGPIRLAESGIFEDEKVFNNTIEKVLNLQIQSGTKFRLDLSIPETVLEEVIIFKFRNLSKAFNSVLENVRKLDRFIKIKKPTFIKGGDLKQKLRQKAKNFLKARGVKIATNPQDTKEIFERCLERKRPFNYGEKDGGSDKGFKDTLIFLSMRDFVLSQKEDYKTVFFVSQNSNDFTTEVMEELSNLTTKTCVRVSDTNELEESLDKLVPLGKHLKERNENIRNLIMGYIGQLVVQSNKTLQDENAYVEEKYEIKFKKHSEWNNVIVPELFEETQPEQQVLVFVFYDLKLGDISEPSPGKFMVSATVFLKPISQEKEEKADPWSFFNTVDIHKPIYCAQAVPGTNAHTTQTVYATVECDLEEKELTIRDIRPGLKYYDLRSI